MSTIKICNPKDNGITMEQITQTISESEDLVVALESVAAMYGIPSSHILANPNAKNIKVEGDMIIAPPKENTTGNTKAIMQSIGAVLDYVSQRVDDHLDDFHKCHINHGKLKEHIARQANPSKGKVIARHVDDEGGEIFVYDTGLIDSPGTKASNKLIKELKKQGKIKSCGKDDCECNCKPSYFSDEDDITIGTTLHNEYDDFVSNEALSETPLTDELGAAAPDPVEGEEDIESDENGSVDIGGGITMQEQNMSKCIKESYETLDIISRYNNTRNIGYEIMMEQGIDYIKPVVYQEASESKKVDVADISYMKFDNTHILKAIKLINEIRAEQPMDTRVAKINYHELVNHEKFKKAIDELSSQFDCRINFRVLTHVGSDKGGNVATSIHENTVKNKITVSKSKGFQLNGTPIDIFTYNSFIEKNVPDDASLFGQYFVAIMCHEIFHNIASTLRVMNNSVSACIAAGMQAAGAEKDPKKKRIIVTNMVDTLEEVEGFKFSKSKKRKLVTDLSILSIFGKTPTAEEIKAKEKENKDAVEEKSAKKNTDTVSATIEKKVKNTKKLAKKIERKKETHPLCTLGIVAGIAASAIVAAAGGGLFALAPLALTAGGVIGTGVRTAKFNDTRKKYDNGDLIKRKDSSGKNTEEFYCDLFAGMYNLPPTFFVVKAGNKRLTANDLRESQLKEIYAADKELARNIQSPYPLTLERDYCAVKIARSTLANNKNVDPAVKKYLEWIIDNYSSTENLNIDTLYSKSTFDPGAAENLDHHLRKLITDNNITVTEYDLSWINDICGSDDYEDEYAY